ncbi:MAG: hypothetical protein WKF30_15585 [Pyrinomonadaceae bacterium]
MSDPTFDCSSPPRRWYARHHQPGQMAINTEGIMASPSPIVGTVALSRLRKAEALLMMPIIKPAMMFQGDDNRRDQSPLTNFIALSIAP